MNFNYNISSALGWTLIHSIWQGVAILLIFSVLYYFIKPPTTKYWLGIGALGLQFLSSIITFSAIYEPVSTIENMAAKNINLSNFLAQTSNITFKPAQLSFLQKIEFFLQNNLDLFVTFWFIGTSLLLFRLMIGFVYVRELKTQQNTLVSADIQELMNNLLIKAQTSISVKLLESAIAKVPMTIGWIKPIVLLPVGMATGLTIRQLEAVLAHELAHIKRYDYLVNIFQNVVEILFFFHPATWWISGKVRDERENCCDDFAVEICGDRLVLANALTQVASYQQQPRLAMAFGAKRQTFMDRIKRIIGINDSKPHSYGNWAAVLGMILVVALGVVYAQKEVVKNGQISANTKNEVSKKIENKLDFYFFGIEDKNVGVYKNNKGEIEKILVEGNELEGKEFAEMKVKVLEFFKDKDAAFVLVKGIAPMEMNQLKNQFFYDNISNDSTSLDEVEAEMERLGKEMEVYGKKMEAYGKLMEDKYGRQMEKHGAEMEQISRKMRLPQKKIQELSIEMQETALAIQKLEMKYDDEKMPADAKQKMADLQKKERELEKSMQLQEAEMQKIEAEMRPFEQKMNNLQYPMDSLSQLMERYNKPMDSLGKLMDEKGKILEKLAKEEEIRFRKQLADFTDMLYKDGLIKNKKDFEIRLKGEKLLIDLEPQSPAVYEKVWNWIDKTWSNNHKSIREKDLRIRVKGENVNFSTHGNHNYNYNYDDNRLGSLTPPVAPKAPMPLKGALAAPAPVKSLRPNPRVPASPAAAPKPPKPPKVVRVEAVKSGFNITDALIKDNKGTCSIYIVSQRNGETFAKAIPAILTNDKWTAKGLKTGDLVVISKEKLKDGEVVNFVQSEKTPKVGQVWLTPEQRAGIVMGNEDAEFERNEAGKDTPIYANPLLLNGQPFDYSKFSIKSKGLLTVMKGKPTSPEAVKIPFRLYIRRNGMIVYEKKSSSKLTEIEISEVLALSQAGDQLIINPIEKVDFKAKRIINVLL